MHPGYSAVYHIYSIADDGGSTKVCLAYKRNCIKMRASSLIVPCLKLVPQEHFVDLDCAYRVIQSAKEG